MTISKKLLHKAGWTALVSLLVAILIAMAYLIITTQRDLAVTQATSVPAIPTSAAEALIAGESGYDSEIQEALDAGDIATLDPLKEGSEFGVATRALENGSFNMEIIVSIADPPVGSSYVAWLDGEELIALGSLIKDAYDENVYLLEFNSPEDFGDLDTVIISLESQNNDLADVPELPILEGRF